MTNHEPPAKQWLDSHVSDARLFASTLILGNLLGILTLVILHKGCGV